MNKNYYLASDYREVSMGDIHLVYAIINDYDQFLKDCGDDYITDGVEENNIYFFNTDIEQWERVDSALYKTISELFSCSSTKKEKENSPSVNTGWNIIITLDNDTVIQTNEIPVSMAEVQEAMSTFLRPCFFGKRIKKFEITLA